MHTFLEVIIAITTLITALDHFCVTRWRLKRVEGKRKGTK